VAPLQTVINLFPHVAGRLQAMADLGLVVASVGSVVLVSVWLRGCHKREMVRLEARSRGLSPASADLLARVLGAEGGETIRALLRSPELLRQRLATELGRARQAEHASRLARGAAGITEELRLAIPPFDGAPRLFAPIAIRDPGDAGAAPVEGWVVAVDESHLTLVALGGCPWPVRRDLSAALPGEEPFGVTLVLRPMPGCCEWVLGHELVDEGVNRRSARRFPCRIAAWTLPTTAGTFGLRARLQGGEPLDPEALRKLEAWPKRHPATIEDLSADGARIAVEHEVRRGDRFYVVLSDTEGRIAALPLAEIVSVRESESGERVLGTRFCAVRLKERVVLADFAQEAAATAAEG
jgi:hypothetical protein